MPMHAHYEWGERIADAVPLFCGAVLPDLLSVPIEGTDNARQGRGPKRPSNIVSLTSVVFAAFALQRGRLPGRIEPLSFSSKMPPDIIEEVAPLS
jgi:hypothetical protein